MLLSQVFSNLLDNALKYRDPLRPLRLQVTGRSEGDSSIYCVADNGKGIARENQEKIWELFGRLDPKGPVSGEGLGLNLVKRIIERHGGWIWVESSPGTGSSFFVALPCRMASPAKEARQA
jgi:signal transduction histidine kinase